MKKIITCLAMFSMVLTSVPAAAFEAAAAVTVDSVGDQIELSASTADIAGKWFYQPKDGKTAGVVTVDENGGFRCVQDQETVDGTVTVHFELHPDGTETVLYKFFTESETNWVTGMLSKDGKTLDLAQDGTAKMTRDETVRKASAAEIAGTWLLKEQKNNETRYSTSGTVTVNTNNTYTYVDLAGNQSTGSAYALYELHPDNTVTIWYSLLDSNGKQWIGCQEDKNDKTPKTLSVGHAAGQILERVSDPFASGFQDVVNPPAASVSAASLSGLWKNTAKPAEVLNVYTTNEKELYNADFTFYDSKGIASAGVVKLQYTLNQDGKEEYWYVFYTQEDQGNGGTELKFWNGFAASGEIPLEDLYAGQSGEPHFHRNTGAPKPNADGFYEVRTLPDTSLSTKNIEGVWNSGKESVTFSDCSLLQGSFKKTNADGTTAEGIVKMEYSLEQGNKQQGWWNLYTKDGKFLMGFKLDGSVQLADLYAGQDGKQHYVRAAQTVTGDLTGDSIVSVEDAQMTLKAYTQRIAGNDMGLTDVQRAAADVDGNGEVSVEDAQYILRYYTEKSVAGKDITWNDLLQKK